MDKFLSLAEKMAKTSIYDGAERLGRWKGWIVYEPTFADDEPRCIGFPQFILVKAETGAIRWTADNDESRAIMTALWR